MGALGELTEFLHAKYVDPLLALASKSCTVAGTLLYGQVGQGQGYGEPSMNAVILLMSLVSYRI